METAFSHQLSTKQQSNVTTITLLKHTSDSQKTPSKLATETTLHHSITQNTGTLRNSVNMSGPLKTTTLTTLFHGVSFHLAHPTTVQVKDVTFASKRNFKLSVVPIYHHLTNVTNWYLLATTETKRCYVTTKHVNLNFSQQCNLKVYSRWL